jgi:transketolase
MTTSTRTDIDVLCVNTIRALAIDAVQAANSGHPGAPMALVEAVIEAARQQIRQPRRGADR